MRTGQDTKCWGICPHFPPRPLGQLAAHGLLTASFAPPEPIRELSDLTRARSIATRDRTRETQRAPRSRRLSTLPPAGSRATTRSWPGCIWTVPVRNGHKLHPTVRAKVPLTHVRITKPHGTANAVSMRGLRLRGSFQATRTVSVPWSCHGRADLLGNATDPGALLSTLRQLCLCRGRRG